MAWIQADNILIVKAIWIKYSPHKGQVHLKTHACHLVKPGDHILIKHHKVENINESHVKTHSIQ